VALYRLQYIFCPKSIYCGIRRFKMKKKCFRDDFPCYSTWKRYKHSGHFSRFCIIIGNFCIANQKCYVLKLVNYIYLTYQSRKKLRKYLCSKLIISLGETHKQQILIQSRDYKKITSREIVNISPKRDKMSFRVRNTWFT
jgi:hypothetical protein